MKYVSPKYQVEALETDDIMNNPSMNVDGATLTGNLTSVMMGTEEGTGNPMTGAYVTEVKDADGNVTETIPSFQMSVSFPSLNG